MSIEQATSLDYRANWISSVVGWAVIVSLLLGESSYMVENPEAADFLEEHLGKLGSGLAFFGGPIVLGLLAKSFVGNKISPGYARRIPSPSLPDEV